MGKKKLPKVSFPELEAMLEDMKELLTDEYGNPLPPDHPQVKRLQSPDPNLSLIHISEPTRPY